MEAMCVHTHAHTYTGAFRTHTNTHTHTQRRRAHAAVAFVLNFFRQATNFLAARREFLLCYAQNNFKYFAGG